MTAIENAAELDIRSRCEAELVVEAADISFHDLTRDTVMVQVKVRNDGERRSSPTTMKLETAPFGAFVPWHPLTTLPAPSLEPGESRVLGLETIRPHPASLGAFDGVPPRKVLTAVNASPKGLVPQQGGGVAGTIVNLLRRQQATRGTVARGPVLSPDLWEFCGREQPHWAGNINVFMRNREVERHFARALRVYAGRSNLTIFDVGDAGKKDAYAFEIVGLAPDWKAGLYDMTTGDTFMVGAADTPIQEKQWVEATSGFMMMVLAVRPPLVCEDGNLQVHVTRRSSQKTAVVEFNLNPTAQGPGCYVAQG